MSKQASVAGELLQLVSFLIETEEFGVDILRVQEIIRPIDITRVPNTPEFIEGVINLRGRVVPVVDLRARFGMPEKERTHNTRIIVVELTDKVVGFMVDSVKEVIRVEQGIIEPPPDLAVGIDTPYIRGVVKLEDRLLILLDLEEVLTEQEQDAIKAPAVAA